MVHKALHKFVAIGLLGCALPFGSALAADKKVPDSHALADALGIAVMLCIDRHPGGADTAYGKAAISSGMMEYFEAMERERPTCVAKVKVSPGLCNDLLQGDPDRPMSEYEQHADGLMRRHRDELRKLVAVNECVYADAGKKAR